MLWTLRLLPLFLVYILNLKLSYYSEKFWIYSEKGFSRLALKAKNGKKKFSSGKFFDVEIEIAMILLILFFG